MNKLLSFTPDPFESDPGASEWEGEFGSRGFRSRPPRSFALPSRPPRTSFRSAGPVSRGNPRAAGAGHMRSFPPARPPRYRFPTLPFPPPAWPVNRFPVWPLGYADPYPRGIPPLEPPSEYVSWMQNCLNLLLGLRLPPDGLLSAATRSALRMFQEQRGLPATGFADPETERALAEACGAEPPAGPAMPEFESGEWESWESEINRNSAEYIRWVQSSLNRILGTRLAVDGISGTQTRAAVRSFQQRRGLVADGIVGPNTEAGLIAAGASPPPGAIPPSPAQPQPYVPRPAPGTSGLLAFGARVSADFRNRVRRIASDIGVDPNFLMAAMAFESAETFSPSIRNKMSGATGLIQFMPSTARALGTTTDALAAMSAEQQLDYVARYFAPYRGRLKTLEDVYMAILWPKAVGASSETVLFAAPTLAYEQNKALDRNGDGRVTKAEAAAPVAAKLARGLQPGFVG